MKRSIIWRLAALLACSPWLLWAATKTNDVLRDPAYKCEVSISIENGVRRIQANGIPDHQVGAFPGKGNPNTIAPQRYDFKMPVVPKPGNKPAPLPMQPFGVAVNGVVFDPSAAEWFNRNPQSGWQYEPMSLENKLGCDRNNAHVQPNGAYHYHGIPTGLVERLTGGQEKMVLLGWAADGYPIYNPLCYTTANDASSPLKKLKSSYRIKQGTRPDGPKGEYDGLFVADYEYVAGLGDLDECNGRSGATPEFPEGTYYYCVTEAFPFIPRSFHGTPDASFARKGPPGGGPPGGRAGGRRPPPGFGPPPPGAPPFGPPPR
ncbi:MAG TPA: YHYH protein [Pirellulales bacterium]|jgi:hypothetical protein|nr:YHYH protein [Pirellulales bacterium]